MAVQLEKERKFLLKYVPVEAMSENLYIIQWYTGDGKRYRRSIPVVKGVFQNENAKHYLTIKKEVSPGVNEEDETVITHDEYLAGRESGWKYVVKDRYVFDAGNGLKWELDNFVNLQLVLLEIELPELDQMPAMPIWLSDAVITEVTGRKDFSNASLAIPRKED